MSNDQLHATAHGLVQNASGSLSAVDDALKSQFALGDRVAFSRPVYVLRKPA